MLMTEESNSVCIFLYCDMTNYCELLLIDSVYCSIYFKPAKSRSYFLAHTAQPNPTTSLFYPAFQSALINIIKTPRGRISFISIKYPGSARSVALQTTQTNSNDTVFISVWWLYEFISGITNYELFLECNDN